MSKNYRDEELATCVLDIPKSVENKIYAVAAKALNRGNPKFLRVPIKPEGEELKCHTNVIDKISREGCGERVVGWSMKAMMTMNNIEFIVLCELHSVYKAPDGTLTDVTPHSEYPDAEFEFFAPCQEFVEVHRESDGKFVNAQRTLIVTKKRVVANMPIHY